MLKEWNRRIPRQDTYLRPEDVVCSLHFEPSDIITEDVFQTKEGEVVKMPRDRPMLAREAVTRIFPNLPERFSDPLKSRPARGERPKVSTKKTPEARQKPEEPSRAQKRTTGTPPCTSQKDAQSKTRKKSKEDETQRNEVERANERETQSSQDERICSSQSRSSPRKRTLCLNKVQEQIRIKLRRQENENAQKQNEPPRSVDVTLTQPSLEQDRSSTPKENDATQPDLQRLDDINHEEPKLDHLIKNPEKVKLPSDRWKTLVESGGLVFAHVDNKIRVDRYVRMTTTGEISGVIRETNTDLKTTVRDTNKLEDYLRFIHDLNLCQGCDDGGRHPKCHFYVTTTAQRCVKCKDEVKIRLRKKRRQEAAKEAKKKKIKARTRMNKRLKRKVSKLSDLLGNAQNEIKKISETQIDKITENLPSAQKEVVKACIMASKTKPQGRRYSPEWVYECILMRIKSPSLYRRMRRENTLPLPSVRTLQRYMRKLKPMYGFQESTFTMIAEKTKEMETADRHGGILIDEMSIDQAVALNKQTMEVEGFVDLGKYTTKENETELADHALVLMYQPFRGSWYQALGAFATKGAAKGEILEKIIVEAVGLCEKHGLFVDHVVADGGPWNRKMWRNLGISADNSTCEHPVDPTRRLRFFSDFPHLAKTMWSRVLKAKTLLTPDGYVKIDHWDAILKHDNTHIRMSVVLSRKHLEPTNFETMNVKLAFQFFDEDVAKLMEHFREMGVPELQDCEASILFIKRTAKVIKAMNSRSCSDALTTQKDNEARMAIEEYLGFLNDWERQVKDASLRLTAETHFGLLVSLKGVLHLVQYLTDSVHYEYLMTRRVNQDGLEHFFGKVREACGSNSHPDPEHFIQIFRLFMTASLIKPPRGSNVSGGDLLTSLVNIKDIQVEKDSDKRAALEERLDQVLSQGEMPPDLQSDYEADHTYGLTSINEYALEMFAGYVVRQVRKSSCAKNCKECSDSLVKGEEEPTIETQKWIENRSRGYLLIPSRPLYHLLRALEVKMLEVLDQQTMGRNIILMVLEKLEDFYVEQKVGCKDHEDVLTKAVMRYFVNTRLIFACKRFEERLSVIQARKRKAKSLLKQHRLNALQPSKETSNEMNTSQETNKRKTSRGTLAAGNPNKKSVSQATKQKKNVGQRKSV